MCHTFFSVLAVGMMSNLKTLDVSHNRIGDKGGCALAAMLFNEGSSSSVPLQSLELEGNQVGGGLTGRGAGVAVRKGARQGWVRGQLVVCAATEPGVGGEPGGGGVTGRGAGVTDVV